MAGRNLLGFKADRHAGRRFVEALDTITPLEDAGAVLLSTVQRKISRSGSTASAPGQPPARRTGAYARSWGMRVIRARRIGGRSKVRVGTDAIEGPPLEFGRKKAVRFARRGGLARVRATKAGSTVGLVDVPPRPHLRPALKEAEGRMLSVFRAKMRSTGAVERRLRRLDAAERRAAREAGR